MDGKDAAREPGDEGKGENGVLFPSLIDHDFCVRVVSTVVIRL